MAASEPTERGSWGSRFGFVLAAAGSAVGLGNLWKFPYIAYENGGGATDQRGAGAFVLIYLAAVLLVGLPIMIAEILIGRRAKRNPVGAFAALRPKTPWKLVGGLGIFTGFLLLSYYNVVAGWTIEYSIKSVGNDFGAFETAVADDDIRDQLWGEHRASADSLATLQAEGLAADLGAPAPEAAQEKQVDFRRVLTDAWADFEKTRPEDFARVRDAKKSELWTTFRGAGDFEAQKRKRQQQILPGKLFVEFLGNPWKQVGWALAFMLLSVAVVIGGISKGIERWTKILMPGLLVLLVVLLVRMLTLEGAGKALGFLFRPNFQHVDGHLVLSALGHAFFTLSLGMGAIITYGSYLGKRDNVVSAGLAVTLMDTAIALMAAITMFSAIFTYGLVMQSGGAGNLFTTIPAIFLQIPGGSYLCVAFYLLVLFAALTSTISLLETVVSYFIDERGWARRKATLIVGGGVFAVGIPSALSFNVLGGVKLFGKTWFDLADYLCANWFLPIGGVLVALFAGWALKRREQRAELPPEHTRLFPFGLWRFLVRYVAPAAVVAVLVGIIVGAVQS